ncbi:MAG: DUF2971 domain-containing protein [Burkholderiaceae bacterium]
MSFLYKYRAVTKNSLESLIKCVVYFSKSVSFNDPFDGQLLPSDFLQELYEIGFMGDATDILNTEGFVSQRLSGYGIFSLSRKCDDILMWSHYADSHKGFCLGFSENLANYIESDAPVWQENVIYADDHPFRSIVRDLTDKKRFNSADSFANLADLTDACLQAALTVKHSSWQYEDEVRVLSEVAGMHTFQPEVLSHVVFGLNMSRDDKMTILKLLDNDTWSHVNVFQANRGKAALALRVDRISRDTTLL